MRTSTSNTKPVPATKPAAKKPAVKKVAAKPAIKKPTAGAKKPAAKRPAAPQPGAAAQLREQLQLTQPQFAQLLGVSPRTAATLDKTGPGTESTARSLIELKRLTRALGEVMQEPSVGPWLKAPNDAFGGLKPLEVIERGESDRLWEMVYFLRSGVAS
ncbi:MAG TPA: hypothetical protein VGE74_02805 [Gemmata sp.]